MNKKKRSCDSGNSKGFRISVPGTRDKGQMYTFRMWPTGKGNGKPL